MILLPALCRGSGMVVGLGRRCPPMALWGTLKLYFDDAAFDGQLQRSVGKSDSGMANVGECLAIVGQITPGDRDS
jgi:hypothetical protein